MTVKDYVRFRERLREHEGFCSREYRDTVGKITIGYGYNVDDRGIEEFERITGRFYDGSVSFAEAMLLLEHVLLETEHELLTRASWITKLNGVRYGVLLDMAYNLGVPGLLKFKKTLASIAAGDYALAAQQMLQSKWARQVKGRAVRLSQLMAAGVEE